MPGAADALPGSPENVQNSEKQLQGQVNCSVLLLLSALCCGSNFHGFFSFAAFPILHSCMFAAGEAGEVGKATNGSFYPQSD